MSTKKDCWKGYRKVGTKMKNGKRVNNCVKMKKKTAKKKMYGGKVKKKSTSNPKPKRASRTGTTLRPTTKKSMLNRKKKAKKKMGYGGKTKKK